MIYENKA